MPRSHLGKNPKGHTSNPEFARSDLQKMRYLAFHLHLNYNCNMKKRHLIKTKYGDFQVSIWYDKSDKTYLVETVGFDKTMTFGASIAEAKRMAKELIELLAECALKDGNVVVDSTMRVVGKKVKPESVLQLKHA